MIKFTPDGYLDQYTFVLAKRNHDKLGEIRNVCEATVLLNENSADEISFTVYKYNQNEAELSALDGDDIDEYVETVWNQINDFKFVWVKELDEYFEITVEESDSEDGLIKSVTGQSACECELSQVYTHDLEINTEIDILRDEYVNPTIFYKPEAPKESLLHRVLTLVPHYSIGHVDDSLKNIQRTFSSDGDDVYSFLTETVAEEIKCIFKFDSAKREISAYDLETVCLDCGHRGEYTDKCPKCKSENIKYYGEDTTIYIDSENLGEEIELEADAESVKNCFKLEAGDDNTTAAVRNLNPNGSAYMYHFSDAMKEDMSDELVEKIESYDALVDSKRDEYESIMQNMYDAIDKVLYYTSGMMPEREDEETDAAKEAAKLTSSVLSPVGLTTVSHTTSTTTVNTAVKNYAKVFIHSGKYKVDVESGEYTYVGYDQIKYNHGTWVGVLRLTNWGDEEDTALTGTLNLEVYDNYKDFIEQKITKKLKEEDDEDGSIFDVLSIDDLDDFKAALKYYCLNRLTSFYDALQGVIDILIESDQGREDSVGYEEFYTKYVAMLDACQAEIDIRKATIDNYEEALEVYTKKQQEIQESLNVENYFGDELYKELCSHKREDEYSNDNFISDGLDNAELFKRAKEFVELAEKEIIKASELNVTISASLLNLLSIEEFRPLLEHFKLGNFIRVKLNDVLYRLRLISIETGWDDEGISEVSVEFSNVTKIRDGVTDTESILQQASSMASTYGYIEHQVDKSKNQGNILQGWIDNGLDLTNMNIVSNSEEQNFVYGENGILVRSYDDITETYSPEQLKIINSTIAFTRDNWQTVDVAIGKYYYSDPKTGEQKMAYGVNGSTIVGQLMLGETLGLYSDDAHMSMEFDNRGLVLNAKKGAEDEYERIFDVQVDGVSKLYIDREGKLIIHNDVIDNIDEDLLSIQQDIGLLEDKYTTLNTKLTNEYSNTQQMNTAIENKITLANESIIASINASEETIKILPGKISIDGVSSKNANFTIGADGVPIIKTGTFSGTIDTTQSAVIGDTLTLGTEESTETSVLLSTGDFLKRTATSLLLQAATKLELKSGELENIAISDEGIMASSEISVTSDVRKKENIHTLNNLDAVLDGLNIYGFNYKGSERFTAGILAQDLLDSEYEKYILRTDKNGFYSVDYNALLMALILKVRKMEAKLQ